MSNYDSIINKFIEFKLKAALTKVGDMYISELKNRLAADGNMASKELLNSLSKEVVGSSVQITASQYLQALSEGKKATTKPPSRPMVTRIEKWMRYKGIRPKSGKMTQLAYRRASFGIAKRINRTQWAGSKVIRRSFQAIEENINQEITQSLKNTLDEVVAEFKQQAKSK